MNKKDPNLPKIDPIIAALIEKDSDYDDDDYTKVHSGSDNNTQPHNK